MIIDLIYCSEPAYFINRRGCLFYSNYESRSEGYYIRIDNSTNGKCINADGSFRKVLILSLFSPPEEIWKMVSKDKVLELCSKYFSDRASNAIKMK